MKSKVIYILKIFFVIIVNVCGYQKWVTAQCTSNVPFFSLDLTGNPDSAWVSTNIVRSGDCCGSTFPDRCISFSVKLDQDAVGIIFDIYSGAIPPGALYYQINCGMITQVGEAICLNGPGPHFLTFCKPGNNINEYIIRSVRGPAASDGVDLYYECSGFIYATGFRDSTLRWNSISPGGLGAFNNYLSCNTACDTIRVDYQANLPPVVLYQVCGTPTAVCGLSTVCDTVAVRYFPNLYTDIQPNNPILCFDENFVQLTANVNNGVPPYVFLWSNGETTQSINAPPGTYHVKVIDQRSCGFATDTVVVNKVLQPVVAVAPSDFDTCNTVSTISLSGNVTGANFMVWSGGTTSFLPNNTSPNVTYSFTSADRANGYVNIILHPVQTISSCPYKDDTVTIFLTNFSATPNAIVKDVSCFGFNNGSIQLTMNNGYPPFLYQWSTGWGLSSIYNLTQGQYLVTVTDANMCTATFNYNIVQPPLMALTSVSNNATCFNTNSGSVSVNVTGGIFPYTYLWSNGATNQNIGNLYAGNYSVTVRDANQCSLTSGFSISQPSSLVLNLNTINNASCYNYSDGSILISVSGGTLPYSYRWNNGATTQNVGNLSAGSYTVTVTDQFQCSITGSYIVNQPPILVLNNPFINHVNCFGGSDGSITVNPSGGTFPYTYLWSNGSTTASINNLQVGSYFLTLADNNQCTTSSSYLINQASRLVINPPVVQNAGCFNGNDGSISVSVSGGVPPYTYNWSNGNTSNINQNLYAGNYGLTVFDQNYCSVTATYNISEPQPILISNPTIQNVTCYGGNNGSILNITASNGRPPYYYSWNTGATTQSVVGIPAGNYSITVYDQELCSNTMSFIVQQPAPTQLNAVVQNVTCFNENNGRILLSPSGGAPPYTYQWSNGSTTQVIFNLGPGAYSVTIFDVLSCFSTTNFIVTQPPRLQIDTFLSILPLCFNDNSGSLTINVSGGTQPYYYQWSNGGNSSLAEDLISGNYSVTVYDSNYCSTISSVFLNQPPSIKIDSAIISDATCYGSANGSIIIYASGGILPLRYFWSNGLTTQSIANLQSGNYSVTIQDANQCTFSSNFFVRQPDEILVNVSDIENVKCFGNDEGRISIIAIGNFPPYTYLWSNGTTSAATNNLLAGTYSVTITDRNNCKTIKLFTVSQPQQVNINANATSESCYKLNNGIITSNVSGGTPGYVINLYLNNNYLTGDTIGFFNGLAPGTYNLIALDKYGCSDTETVIINTAFEDQFEIKTDSVSCPEKSDGTIIINALTLQNAPYNFRLNDSINNYSGIFAHLSSGVYQITITNKHGCDTIITTEIIEPIAAYIYIVPDSITITLGQQIQYDVIFGPYLPSSVISYEWQPKEALSCSDCPNPIPLNFGLINHYRLKVTYNDDCVAEAKAVIYVDAEHKVFIPNIFSPNGDGRNDYFEIYGNKEGWKEMEFYIFDRWGELVFETADKNFKWDGIFRGQELNPAVFVYKTRIVFLDGLYRDFNGSITLTR